MHLINGKSKINNLLTVYLILEFKRTYVHTYVAILPF